MAAMRAVFCRAADAGLITVNLAAALAKPRRTRSRRRALDDQEFGELINAVRTTSNDPDLDLLVLRFHLESGARREGALNLRHRDLDAKRATVWLREKVGRCPARSPRLAAPSEEREKPPCCYEAGLPPVDLDLATAIVEAIGQRRRRP